MENKELAETLLNLSKGIAIKESIVELKIGHALDHKFAIEILGMKHSPNVTEVKLPLQGKVSTQYSMANGQPAILPRISSDNNIAVRLLQDIGQNFTFEFRDGVFKVPYEDKALFEGKTLGEAVMKSLLFGKAVQEAGVTLE